MGASGSRDPPTSIVNTAKRSFRTEEKAQLSHFFKKTAHGGHTFTYEQFQEETRNYLTEHIIERLFSELVKIGQRINPTRDAAVSEEGLLVCAHYLLTASLDERASAVVHFSADTNHLSHEQLQQLIRDLISSYVLAESASPEFGTWRFGTSGGGQARLTDFLAAELKPYGAPDGGCSSGQMVRWFANSSVMLALVDAVFRAAFQMKLMDEELNLYCFPTPTIPFCLGANWSRMATLLDVPSLFFLNQHLPNEHRRQWKLLFSSRFQGESFSKMANQTAGKGPCIVIVKSADGCVFGAFASAGFVTGPSFVGDPRCFLFSVEPHMAIYTTTGYNSNFAYLNSHQQQMPNGMGMGGSIDSGFWSFFLDSEYGTGMSQARGTTFNSPSLSTTPQFRIDTVEVWAVGTRRKPTLEEEEMRTSVLDIDPEIKAILAMSGRRLVSEGIRESDAKASSPEEHEDPRSPH